MSDSLLTTRSIEMIFSVKWESKLTVPISLFHTQIAIQSLLAKGRAF